MQFNSLAAIQQRIAEITAEITELQTLKKELPSCKIHICVEPATGNQVYCFNIGKTSQALQLAAIVSIINAGIDELQTELQRIKIIAQSFNN